MVFKGDFEDDYPEIAENFDRRLTRVEEVVTTLDHIVRGVDGEPGLNATVLALKQVLEKSDGKQYITWAWLVEKGFTPVTIAVIVYVLTRVLTGD